MARQLRTAQQCGDDHEDRGDLSGRARRLAEHAELVRPETHGDDHGRGEEGQFTEQKDPPGTARRDAGRSGLAVAEHDRRRETGQRGCDGERPEVPRYDEHRGCGSGHRARAEEALSVRVGGEAAHREATHGHGREQHEDQPQRAEPVDADPAAEEADRGGVRYLDEQADGCSQPDPCAPRIEPAPGRAGAQRAGEWPHDGECEQQSGGHEHDSILVIIF